MLMPWLSSKLDPNLRKTYNFECMLANHRREAGLLPEPAHAGHGGGDRGGPRRRRSSLNQGLHGRSHPASAPESPLNKGPALLKRGATADSASFERLLVPSPLDPVFESQQQQHGYDADEDAKMVKKSRVAAENRPYPVGFP